MQRSFILAIFAFILGTFSAIANPNHLNEELESYIKNQELTGAYFFANIDGETSNASAGTISQDSDAAPNNDTRFYIASSGKMMVAAAVLALVEEGKIGLDEPIWPVIKDIPDIDALENADKVTLRQILNHTSGLAEYLDEEFDDAANADPTKRWSSVEALEFAYDFDANFEPNEDFEYTNTNYVLLGYILEHFDGSLETALQKRIFDKAGMENSSVGADPSGENLAHGYNEFGEDASAQAWASILGDGPVVSTAEDLSKFMHALFEKKTIIGDALIDEMLTGSDSDDSYGLGMGIDGDDYGDWYGHAGSYGGYEADVRYYPEQNASMVILMNGNPAEEPVFLDIAAKELLGH
jgi:D-alanyl-D-alanine carboxypeptidase